MKTKLLATLALGTLLAANSEAKSLLFSLGVDDQIAHAPAPSRNVYATLNVFRTGAGVLKIQLAAPVVPAGISITFSENPVIFTAKSPGIISSTVNVNVGPEVADGTYTVEITAVDLIHHDTDSVLLTFTVEQGTAKAAPPQLAICMFHLQDLQVPKISWNADPGQAFMVQATASLSEPIVWSNLGYATANTDGGCEYTDGESSLYPMRFYRVLAQ